MIKGISNFYIFIIVSMVFTFALVLYSSNIVSSSEPCPSCGPPEPCFLPNTLIQLSDGSYRKISDLKIGDLVKGFDNNGDLVVNVVNKVIVTESDGYFKIRTFLSDVSVTGEHPFYVGNGQYKKVNDLKVGDFIYTLSNGNLVKDRIVSMQLIKGKVKVYNLEVSGTSNYFANSFAVHNKHEPPERTTTTTIPTTTSSTTTSSTTIPTTTTSTTSTSTTTTTCPTTTTSTTTTTIPTTTTSSTTTSTSTTSSTTTTCPTTTTSTTVPTTTTSTTETTTTTIPTTTTSTTTTSTTTTTTIPETTTTSTTETTTTTIPTTTTTSTTIPTTTTTLTCSIDCSTLNGWVDTDSFACSGDCQRCKPQEYRDYRCEGVNCVYSVTDNKQLCEQAPSGKHCSDGTFTSIGYCDSSEASCQGSCGYAVNRFECGESGKCDQVDYSDVYYCPENTACVDGSCTSDASCSVSGYGCVDYCTASQKQYRCDGLNGCVNFWKDVSAVNCSPYACASGVCTSSCSEMCGAACENNNDCNSFCFATVRYFNGQCGNDCACSFTSENCAAFTGWYNTSVTRWTQCTECKECEQLQQVYRDYYCSPESCQFHINTDRWTDTGNVREIPDCPPTTTTTTIPTTTTTTSTTETTTTTIPTTTTTIPETTTTSTTTTTVPTTTTTLTCSSDCNLQDNWYDTGSFACNGNCERCKPQEFRDYSCVGTECVPAVTDTRNFCESAPTGQHCSDNVFTSIGFCDSSEASCHGSCAYSVDRFECGASGSCDQKDYSDVYYCQQGSACSNGVCNSDVACSTSAAACTDGCNSKQSQYQCDGLNGCNEFWRYVNSVNCSPYSCSSGSCTGVCSKACGANCESDTDCANFCVDDTRHFDGSCGSSCSCSFGGTENCNFYDGWYNTTVTRLNQCAECKMCEQIQQVYRNYFCSPESCQFNVNGSRWVDTGVVNEIPDCPTTTTSTTTSTTETTTTVPTTTTIVEIPTTTTLPPCVMSLELSDKICPKDGVTLTAHAANAEGKVVYFKTGSCDGATIGMCGINGGACNRLLAFSNVGTYNVFACVDRNFDGDFNDACEQSNVTVNVDCNNCLIQSDCLNGDVCEWCAECAGVCNHYVNQYHKDICLNSGETCTHACEAGYCDVATCGTTWGNKTEVYRCWLCAYPSFVCPSGFSSCELYRMDEGYAVINPVLVATCGSGEVCEHEAKGYFNHVGYGII